MSKKIKENSGIVYPYIIALGTLLLMSILLGLVMLALTVIPSDLNLIKVLVTDIRLILLNSWPLFCIMVLSYFLTNRIWIGFLSTSVIAFIIAEINRFKMTFRDDPFLFSDISLVNEAKGMLEEYKLFLDKVSLIAIIFILAVTIICFFKIKIKLYNKVFRGIGSVVAIVVLCVSCMTFYFENDEVHDSISHVEFGTEWKTSNDYMARGVIYSFIHSMPDIISTPPEGYDEKNVQEVLATYEDNSLEEEQKVHIISIMLEAYNDFSQFDGVEFSLDPYTNFHQLQQEGYSGQLFTDTFAGGTILTERSFLTGFRNTETSNKEIISFVRYFKEQGYCTKAMHPGYGWFYNRRNINTYLGFESFDYYENQYSGVTDSLATEDKYQDLMMDACFFDYIIEDFEKALEQEQRYFNFSVTYQNHGPYDTYQNTNDEYLIKKDEYSVEQYNIINNYLYWVSKTDESLGKLKEYIDQQEEPVVLILFGDHNPWLGEDKSVYKMLGINVDISTVEGGANCFQTPYLFYANESAKENLERDFVGEGNTISPMFLMTEYFDYIGVEGPMYLNYLSDVKEQYSVIHARWLKNKDGFVMREDDYEDDILQMLDQVEYYMKNSNVAE